MLNDLFIIQLLPQTNHFCCITIKYLFLNASTNFLLGMYYYYASRPILESYRNLLFFFNTKALFMLICTKLTTSYEKNCHHFSLLNGHSTVLYLIYS